jgi:hypothetical protein
MRRLWLRLSWRDGAGVVHPGLAQPVDLQTRAAEEFPVFVDMAAMTHRIRLDRILRVAGPPDSPAAELLDQR